VRSIYLANLDKPRPVLVLTRESMRLLMHKVTVAPITTTVKGLSTEVPVGQSNGLDAESVVSCDNIQTISATALGRFLGFLRDDQEPALREAIENAFDLEASTFSGVVQSALERSGTTEPGSEEAALKKPRQKPRQSE
jgi:mRNA interferase MazF